MDLHQLIVDEHQLNDAVIPIDLRYDAAFPEFLLPDDSGFLVWSRELMAQGPYVLFYFHGGWCETCIHRLTHLDALRQQFYKMGVAVVAVSPDIGNSPRQLKDFYETSAYRCCPTWIPPSPKNLISLSQYHALCFLKWGYPGLI